MSQEITLIAIIKVAPGKWEKLNELFANALKYMQESEPETLEFRVFKEDADSSRGVLIERYVARHQQLFHLGVVLTFVFARYASQAALERHQSTESYQNFFKNMQEEQILSGAPEMLTGRFVYGFQR